MPDQNTTQPKTAPSSDRVSLTALTFVLVLTNVWFVATALPYVN